MSFNPTRARTARSKYASGALALLLVVSATQLISNLFIYNTLAAPVHAQDASQTGQLTWNDVLNFLKTKASTSPEAVLVNSSTTPVPTTAIAATPTPQSSNNLFQVTQSGQSQVGSQLNFDIKLNNDSTNLDSAVDFEIYNGTTKVYQKFFEHQNLNQGSANSYQLSWTPTTQGSYTLKGGIFSSGWTQTLKWSDNLVALNITAGQTTQAPTQTPIGTTPTTAPVANNTVNNSGTGTYTVGGDGRIYKNGQKITLAGVSWFGAETDTKVPHGLWSRGYKDMISQMKQTGFNAVRLPYCPQTLQNVDASGIDAALNPDLTGLKTLDVMDKIVAELNNQGMYILLDNHRPDCQAQSDLWYTGSYSEQQWISDLVMLSNRYKNVANFIGLDLKNEPKGAATWGTGNAATDWDQAVAKAGRQILAANPNILLFVDGIENNPTCSNNTLGHWWGGNLEPVACKDIDSSAVPTNKVVFAPHAYGPDTYNQPYFNTSDFPNNMTAIWDQNFGFLKNNGRAIAIGEYGGKYGAGDPKDVTWQNAFVDYLSKKGICDNFYWDWNPNSGDTGGILQDDWKSVNQGKVDLLSKYRNQCK